MNRIWKTATAGFLVLALLGVLCVGCGEEEEGEKVTIVIGEITDLTGPTTVSLLPVHYVTEDLVKYYNEEGLIPGVELKLATYDCRYDPARDVPGFDWVRERGAEVVLAPLYSTAEILKPFAERQRVPVVTSSPTEVILEPPGWVFTLGARFTDQLRTVLKWISENHWNYAAEERVPKVGFAGWYQSASIDAVRALTEYCQVHSDKFEWVGGYYAPVGTMTFPGEVEKLKDCDYICPLGYIGGFFIRDFHARGYEAAFFGESSASSFKGFYVDLAGWEGVDGMLSTNTQGWVSDPYPMLGLSKELLYENRPDEADDLVYAGTGYVCGFVTFSVFFEMIRNAVEEVGAENFDGQAFYDASLDFEVQFEGFPKWYFTESERGCIYHAAIYEWRAEVEDLVMVSNWLPLVTE